MKKKLNRVIAVLTIACALIAIASALFNYLLPVYLSYKFNLVKENIKNASSIGIIGGADGPTVVFVAGQSHAHLITIIFAVLAILGIIYLFIEKRMVNKT